MALIWS